MKELLRKPAVRKRLRAARNEAKAVSTLKSIATKNGLRISDQWIRDLFDDIRLADTPFQLTESDLLGVAGSIADGDTAPKLCHTDSCGGGHAGCC